VTAAIGTDTGGSIRIPAALCGVVGFKPTFDRLPVDGVWPLAPSLDHVGIFGADVTTVHEVFRAVDDVQSVDDTTSTARTVGVIVDAALGLVDPAVVRALAQVRTACERLGWATVDAQLPEADLVIRTHRVIATSEIYRVFAARSWADSGRFGPDLSTLIADGSQHSQQDLLDANVQRAQLVGAIDGLFADCDLLVVPACAAGAPRIGEDFVEVGGQRDTRRSALMRFICLYNMTGHPAVSLPVGATDDGRPIGVQLVGRTGADVPLLVAAAALEAAVVNQ
jgi:aspartyl-tRNA(Asn)/glutamyl-tRNA(Gln) amidotransferase subunit A